MPDRSAYPDVVNSKLPRLSRFYRINNKEAQVISHLRVRMKMSVNHIASLLGRSTASIHTFSSWYNEIPGVNVDNRRNSPRARSLGVISFKSKMLDLRIRIGLYLRGVVASLEEALALRQGTLSIFFEPIEESENSDDEQEKEPH
jgi:hypothetical protein